MKGIYESYDVIWTEYAYEQLVGIYRFIKRKTSHELALKYTERLKTQAYMFDKPFLWQECPELQTKKKIYRQKVVENYRIIGKVVGDKVYILDVFHTKRDPQQIKKLKGIKL